ncbi:MAG: hypothetical protein K8F52_07705 [Candidatus Scalindua rubra]|uniref:CopG family transcriptional regulator n=1 Tax=Candidatus Scalindua brodae TaxID=237368 RepID=A0A0B0EPF1_9BACT|nr:MAG: hypothetical protein SCABRO_01239 [Candidatus Scalindua brodae]MBZ0108540.1 hypothetical protein [Candidatus Scalindua rubra]
MKVWIEQANFLLPKELLEDLKKNVPCMEQSKVVAEALRKELKSIKLEKVLKEGFGEWKKEHHPELAEGTDKYIRRIRKSSR